MRDDPGVSKANLTHSARPVGLPVGVFTLSILSIWQPLTPPLLPDWEGTPLTPKGLKKRCVLRGSSTCRPPCSKLGAELAQSSGTAEAAAGGMSGGKRNHEDLSDMMALVEAACKVPAISARPFAYR